MSRVLWFGIIVWLCVGAIGAGSHRPSGRYALLIGVGQYPSRSGLEPLNARNDLRLMAQTLRSQGFSADHIITLADAQATRQGITQTLDSLTRALPSGSCLIVYFSGHSMQLTDDNGDEPDRLDEAIIPYDGLPKRVVTLIRDDELGRHLARLRQRIGPAGQLLFLFDSCHSGSMLRQEQRGQATSRGIGQTNMTTPAPDPNTSGWFEPASTRAIAHTSPYVLVAATTDGQPSYECTDASGQAFGPLTLAVCRSFTGPPALTYRAFYERVRQQMSRLAPYQQPTLEGYAEAPFLGGN